VPTVRSALSGDAEACVEILRRLPGYFTPDTHADARAAVGRDRAWVASEFDNVVGFVAVEQRSPRSAEITFAAVTPERRAQGIGSAMIVRALSELADEGVAIVEVKTLDSSSGDAPYVATRAFWERRGFVQIDCIDPLPGWQPGNPSAIYVAALAITIERAQADLKRPSSGDV
jgi:ribosomal protein S18 acetylase RimI-like enzyme